MDKEHVHVYEFVNSELIASSEGKSHDFKEIAKVICTKCGEVKNVEVK